MVGGKLSRELLTPLQIIYIPSALPSYINPPSLFRPVEFSPTASVANVYGAMVVEGKCHQ
jgi:hypothetical protein